MRERLITIDIDEGNFRVLRYKQFDNNNILRVAITEKKEEVDLSEYTAYFFFKLPSGDILQKNTEIEDNKIKVILDNGIFNENGRMLVEITLTNNDQIVTTFSMYFDIEETIDRNEAVLSKPEWDLITNAFDEINGKVERDEYLEKVNEIENNLASLESNKVNKTEYNTKINEIGNNLNNKVNKTEYNTKINEIGNNLTSLENNKVNKTEYNTKINEIENNLNNKVNKTEYDTKINEIENDITNCEGNIQTVENELDDLMNMNYSPKTETGKEVIDDFNSIIEDTNRGYFEDIYLKGRTLVNVCNQEESTAVTESYTVKNMNQVPLQGEDGGKCRPIVMGNTLVNRAYGEDNILTMPKIEVEGNNITTVTNGLDGGKVEMEIEGNTLVNLIQKKNLSLYAKSGSHPSFSRTINGNFCEYVSTKTDEEKNSGYFTIKTGSLNLMKPSTKYTLIFTIKENSYPNTGLSISFCEDAFYGSGNRVYLNSNYNFYIGTHIIVFESLSDFSPCDGFGFGVKSVDDVYGSFRFVIGEVMLFEGDLTQTPELIPTEYIEGLKSSFENEKIPENLSSSIDVLPYIIKSESGNAQTIYKDNFRNTNEKAHTIALKLSNVQNPNNERLFIDFSAGSGSINISIYPQKDGWYYTSTNKISEGNLWIYFLQPVNASVTLENIMILEGDWTQNPLAYEEVMEYSDKYKCNIKTVGKNKLKEIITTQSVDVDTGNLLTNVGNWITSNLIPIKPNTAYTYSVTSMTNKNINYVYYNKHGIHLSHQGLYNLLSGTMTSPENAYYMRVRFPNENLGNVQIEEGTTATEYEPYKSSTEILYLNSPLLEGDEIKVIDGKLGHYHKMGKVVLDGSEEWKMHSFSYEQDSLYRFNTLINNMANGLKKVISSKFPVNNFSDFGFVNRESIDSHPSEKTLNIWILKTRLGISTNTPENITNFKQWLQANPTTVVYELANPYFEPLVKANALSLDVFNTNITISINSVVPVNSTVNNLGYALRGFSEPYTVSYESNGEITYEVVDNRLRLYGNGTRVWDVMLVDGENTATNEYFEGLQSCFENEKIPENLSEGVNDLLPFTITNDKVNPREIFKYSCLNLKPNQVYTYIVQASNCSDGVNVKFSQDGGKDIRKAHAQIDIHNGLNVFKSASDCTSDEVDENFWIYVNANKIGHATIEYVLILEGDWTKTPPTYEEVMEYSGKYKVEIVTYNAPMQFGKGGRR